MQITEKQFEILTALLAEVDGGCDIYASRSTNQRLKDKSAWVDFYLLVKELGTKTVLNKTNQ